MSDLSNQSENSEASGFVGIICKLHDKAFGALSTATGQWFLPTAARFAFASVIFFFLFNSALTKFGGVPFGLGPGDNVFSQFLGETFWVNYGGDPSAVPWYMTPIAWAGMYGELLLPIMVVLGLFTRIASLGMIIFIFVMSYVDIFFHGLDAKSVGSMFDGAPGGIIADQRLLWVFLLLVLVIRGAGPISLDAILSRKK